MTLTNGLCANLVLEKKNDIPAQKLETLRQENQTLLELRSGNAAGVVSLEMYGK